ncbi:MAG: hypothetical protein QXQ81_07765 [Candidatus Thorarchaeota archaeon]
MLLVVTSLTVPVAAKTTTIKDAQVKPTIGLIINGADYGDLDGDGLCDDAVGWFDIYLSGSQRYSFFLSLSIENPSGVRTTYSYSVNTIYEILHCTMYFYDHVVESGDYVFIVEALLVTGGSDYQYAEYVFDPPGGSGNSDPCGLLLVTA